MSRLTRCGLTVAAVSLAIVAWPALALAHPLGNFTINLYSGIQLTPHKVQIEYVVDMAEIPTFEEMANIDVNGDGVATDAEKASWAKRQAPVLLKGVSLSVGGKPVALHVASSSMRFRPGQGGLPILRFEGTFAGSVPAAGTVEYRDDNYPGRIGWREITAVGEDGAALTRSSVPAQSISDSLLSYPVDMLSSPLHVTQATVAFAPGVSAPAPSQPAGPVSSARPGVTGGAFAGLVARTGLTLPVIVLSLFLAMAFGALHAIGPGHGKTLMAAYLVGAGGRMRQAVAVGGAVAVMHTASVLGLGLVVLSAERLFPPERIYPWLGLLSGLVALGLGAGLLVIRLGAWSNAHRAAGHVHGEHGHAEEGSHVRDGVHGRPHGHTHAMPDAPVLSRKGLMALAVAGGILPSPTALVVLLAAVALHRVAFGLALIGGFSIGLAGALIAVGVIALRARDLVSRKLSTRWGQLLPVLSAAAIVGVGLFFTIRGIVQVRA